MTDAKTIAGRSASDAPAASPGGPFRPSVAPLLALLVAYLALILAWVFGNPAGVGPDEAQHYLKALAAGSGEIYLDERPPPLGRVEGPIQRQKAVRFMGRQTRMVDVPKKLSPEAFACRAVPGQLAPCPAPPVSGGQTEFGTYVGTYPPLPYFLPGLAMRLGSSAVESLLLARLASGITSAAFLLVAAVVLWSGRRPPLVMTGLLAAVSPMVIFASATLSGSGLEVASAICFFACLLALAGRVASLRDAKGTDRMAALAPPWIWAAAGVSGSVLAMSRDLGPGWVLALCSLYAGLVGLRRAWLTLRLGGKPAWWAAGALIVANVAGVAWAAGVQNRPSTGIRTVLDRLGNPLPTFARVVREQIGVFGPLDTPMPPVAYQLWALALAALLFGAFVFGTARHRLVLGAAVLGSAVLTSFLDTVQTSIGFNVQGRHLLPLAVTIPLLAGHVLSESSHRLPPVAGRASALLFAGTCAFVHGAAWLTIARRYSVGPAGPWDFLDHSRWAPPLGWVVWAAVAAAGAGLLLAFGLLASGPAESRTVSPGSSRTASPHRKSPL